jgi:hypothetical protein
MGGSVATGGAGGSLATGGAGGTSATGGGFMFPCGNASPDPCICGRSDGNAALMDLCTEKQQCLDHGGQWAYVFTSAGGVTTGSCSTDGGTLGAGDASSDGGKD